MKYKFFTSLAFLLMAFSAGLLGQGRPDMRFNHLAIFVTNLQQSRQFYTNVIGLDTLPEPFHDGKHLWLALGFGSSLHVISGAPNKIAYFPNNHLCLSTSSMDELKKTLEKNKVDWKNAQGQKGMTTTRPDGILQIWVQDPDGYWIEINNDQSTLGRGR
jgi:lactoylglutathione lyase